MIKSRIRIISINLVLLLVVAAVGWWGWSALHPAPAKVTTTTTVAQMGDVTSSVSASGTVISPGDVGVSPTVNGLLTAIHVRVGQRVAAGDVMAELDHTALKNTLNSASAALKTIQIQLSQSAASVLTAKDNAAANAITYKSSVDTAKKALDDATTNATSSAITYQASVDSAQRSLDAAALTLKNLEWTYSQTNVHAIDGSALTAYFCKTYMNQYQFVNSVTVNASNANCNPLIADSDAVDNATAALNTAKANQASSILKDNQSLVSLKNAYNSALVTQSTGIAKDQQAITTAQQNYDIAKAQQGVNVDNPSVVDFQVAQAALELAQKNYDASFIRAPVSGTVASISASVGMNAPTASSSTVGAVSGFIVLTDVSSLQVSAGFSESDAAKLVVGQNVTYSFAALPNLVATGKLLSIDLLPTTTSGATSYKATFAITEKVPTLKPGMTATVTVTTGAAMNVLQVASQAVTIRGSGASVNVITTVAGKDVITRTPVVVGLQGDSADQIISGIKPGTKVVLRSVSASVGTNGFPSVGIPGGLGAAGLAGAAGGGGGARGGRNGG